MTEHKKYQIRFYFDYGADSCLWPYNDAAFEKFDGMLIRPHKLPLSPETAQKVIQLADWFQDAGWPTSSVDPWPLWRQDECDRFNAAVEELFAKVQQELGNEYELINEARKAQEHPDLDEFLANPDAYFDGRVKSSNKSETKLTRCISTLARFFRFVM